ncbi:hypothetical protein CPU12_06245 [Malaciobacter molluscorum LMG 25693]|uniref:Uncharacterized protein n=1 Tax=Malaciobacter molluscorum LMG 25693 TaxID=870501 RepID=A0A2G1DIK4_9BACT|nr:DUF6172 family protein [Malaciobacter molluscorum]AXX91915.1 hypothetical protein AMOL_0922 [Malaciobacter molluscorum LMG 25693]PHO18317.1 hypothetical protein CPU12_06245 [Malaciobacter molluscorum LMG 25693]
MKKTFKIQVENKHPDRVVEGIKHEVRKYIKREKGKKLPEDKDFWFFDCKFAKEDEEPKTIDFTEITKSIDEAAQAKCKTFYLEILARAEKRPEKEVVESEDEDTLKE